MAFSSNLSQMILSRQLLPHWHYIYLNYYLVEIFEIIHRPTVKYSYDLFLTQTHKNPLTNRFQYERSLEEV
jgi:hypothetical protein